MATSVPPIPRDPIGESHKWREWFNSVRNNIEGVAGSSSIKHNTLKTIQGGTSTERYHLTSAQLTGLVAGGATTLHTHTVESLADVSSTSPTITGQVLVWDNTAEEYVPIAQAYGEMYLTNGLITVTVSVIDTAYEVTTGLLEGETLRTTFGGDHYLTVPDTGMYKIIWSLSMATSTSGDEIEAGYMVNGTASEKGTSHTSVRGSHSVEACGASAIVSLSSTVPRNSAPTS